MPFFFIKRMLRIENFLVSILLSFLSMSVFAPSAIASPSAIEVFVDEARLVELSQPVSQVIIGNPAIADVAMQSRKMLVFTGKSVGHTNIILLDENNNQILNRKVEVTTSNASGLVMVYRGASRSSYHCGTVCNGRIALGDNPKFTNNVVKNTEDKLNMVNKALK
jgi:hypothetical protein